MGATGVLIGLAHGLAGATTPINLLAVLIGVTLGTMVGVLPGMTPTATMAVLLTFTALLPTETAFITLGGIYFGSQYGNSITAILLNVPSEPPSVVVARHGYRFTKRGRSGVALTGAAFGSFIGVMIGLVGLSLTAPFLSHVAAGFTPSAFFLVALAAVVTLLLVMNGGSATAILSLCIGMALGTVGIDPITGQNRFTFGVTGLLGGVQLVPVAVGLFGIAELLRRYLWAEPDVAPPRRSRWRELLPTVREWVRTLVASVRGGVLGFLVGSIPGPSLLMGVFSAYAVEEKLGKRRYGSRLDEGQIELVAGPKAADDAAVSGALVPLLTLGVPFTPVTAMLFASLLLHNIHPGPLFIQDHAGVFWSLVVAMAIGNLCLLVLNFPLVGVWVQLLRVPERIRFPLLMVVAMLGVYSLRFSFFDLWVLLLSSVLGLVLIRIGFDRILIILGLILGGPMETALRQSLIGSGGSLSVFVSSPANQVMVAILAALIGGWSVLRIRTRRRQA
ncbi:MAG: tripartite tricarboxylate transporter permease [Thermaerobacter sp.]|nr:tripartite tricarboxylate transporter permease [Thermaerobacter sp.]